MSENSRRKRQHYSAEFRQQALEQMKSCGNVKALAKQLGVARQQLYWWRQLAEQQVEARDPGVSEDPRDGRIRALTKQVAELEGVVGQKSLELDFFAGALCRVEEFRQKKGMSGETASTAKSASGCKRKAD